VVDDCSTDSSVAIARDKGVKVYSLPRRSGPATARNYGAEKARGSILLFIDSDVMVHPDTLERVVIDFDMNPGLGAVFGSYDDSPAENNFLSQYKNLSHRFYHQQASSEAVTFWAGCGAIRKEVFQDVGGFDQERYQKACIEDIELGYRIRKRGYRILLDKDLQVKHLKQWRFGSLLRADILYRAIPWTKLMLENKEIVNDLNLQISQRISAGLVGLSVGILPFLFFIPRLVFCIPLLLGGVIALNHKLYLFFFKRKGLTFTLRAFPMHLLYYLYSGLTFVTCWCAHIISSSNERH
jgi:GT2 family glycosyltransferase